MKPYHPGLPTLRKSGEGRIFTTETRRHGDTKKVCRRAASLRKGTDGNSPPFQRRVTMKFKDLPRAAGPRTAKRSALKTLFLASAKHLARTADHSDQAYEVVVC
jgi:hypothetical protein